jgi:hypothetical protein
MNWVKKQHFFRCNFNHHAMEANKIGTIFCVPCMNGNEFSSGKNPCCAKIDFYFVEVMRPVMVFYTKQICDIFT